jgi:hypothetical protein
MFVKARAPFAWETLIVSRLIPPERTVVGFHDLEIPAAWLTVRFAAAAKALLPWSVTRAPALILFVRVPVVAFGATATGTVIVQLPPAGIVPPDRVIEGEPGTAPTVPPHVVVAAGEAATVNPVPIVVRSSVNDVIAALRPPAFDKVIVSVVVWLWTTVDGLKLFAAATDVAAGFTVSVALPVEYPTVPNVPVGIVLFQPPIVVPWTVAEMAQLPLLLVVALVAAGIVPPESCTCVAVKLAVPPHVVDMGPTTVIPAGMTSTKSAGLMAVRL